MDFLNVRRLANAQVVTANQTRWYSPLSFMSLSLRKTPSPCLPSIQEEPRTAFDSTTSVDSISNEARESEERVGTLRVSPRDVGRRRLRPKPSLDLNDPLNWSSWQKYSAYLVACFFSFLAAADSSKFTPSVVPLSEEFEIGELGARYLISFNLLLFGLGNVFWVPLMRLIGKRPVLLVSLAILGTANIWASMTHDFNALLASQILSGFASSATEAPVAAMVADLFFVHERGTKLMIFHGASASGTFLGIIVNSYIVEYSSWRACCKWIAVACGITWLATIIAIPETNFQNCGAETASISRKPEKSFARKLILTTGFNKNASPFRSFRGIFALCTYPSVFWSALTSGIFVAWSIELQIASNRAWANPPYKYKAGPIGLYSVSSFIGTLFALFFGGKLIDMISNRATMVRDGVREPEYRLYALMFPAIIGPMGLLLSGLTLWEHTPLVQPAIGYAMNAFGLVAISNILVVYAVDSYFAFAEEVLAIIFSIRGVAGMAAVLGGIDWMKVVGEKNAFGIMVGIQYFICLWTLIFLIFGKMLRCKTTVYGPLTWTTQRR